MTGETLVRLLYDGLLVSVVFLFVGIVYRVVGSLWVYSSFSSPLENVGAVLSWYVFFKA